jgi:hypothetical protein
MKSYRVTIKAEVIKAVEVEASSQEEAEAVAHELFNTTPSPDGAEKYNQETISIYPVYQEQVNRALQ